MESFKLNKVCQILGIQKPVIQAPLAYITSPKLVAAVSNAGGLGVIGMCCNFDKNIASVKESKEEMRKRIRETHKLTNKPFGLNITPSSQDPYGFSKANLELCKEENVKVIVMAGNLDVNEIRQLKKDGFTVIAREQNPTVRGALAAEKAGADIIVATGCDEGGCMPSKFNGTTSITALISDAVNIPVLAAGGIINKKMARIAHIAGAEGAFVGTRFILSKECPASDIYKKDIMNTHPDDYLVFTHSNGELRWRLTPHKIAKDGINENKKGNLNPTSGNWIEGIVKGNLDAGVNSVCNLAPLIKSIDYSKDIVNEIARGFI